MKQYKKIVVAGVAIFSLTTGMGVNYIVNEFARFSGIIDKMTKENIDLVRRNNSLREQKKLTKKRISERRKKLTKRNVIRAERKLVKAAGSMIPVAGIAVITTATAFEIKEYCDDIREMKTFESELFGDNELMTDPEEEKLCGIDVEKELQPIAKAQMDEARQWIGDSYDTVIEHAKRKAHEIWQTL